MNLYLVKKGHTKERMLFLINKNKKTRKKNKVKELKIFTLSITVLYILMFWAVMSATTLR